jgi:hypothetical protein
MGAIQAERAARVRRGQPTLLVQDAGAAPR